MFHGSPAAPQPLIFGNLYIAPESYPDVGGYFCDGGHPFVADGPPQAGFNDDAQSEASTEEPPAVAPPLSVEELRKLAKAEKRKRRRATLKYRTLHASRERIRVESFNKAFAQLRSLLPTTPADKKLSKIEILRVSISYIQYLNELLSLS
uniref:BHLH domain-containing protein n=1 Tax=Panagrellus redivivus TaxID=6233 RepID=A0A7E4ZTL7_PANRE